MEKYRAALNNNKNFLLRKNKYINDTRKKEVKKNKKIFTRYT